MYDLLAPGRDYENLYNAIRSYGTWGKLTESTWAILSTKSSMEILNHLRIFMDANDRLVVIKSGRDASWANAKANNEWLKKNLVL